MKAGKTIQWVLLCGFICFVALSYRYGFTPGVRTGQSALSFVKEMAGILPPAFVLVGLFEVWVKRETIEKHLGRGSGVKGYLWAVALAGSMVGGIYVALPLCYALQKKGASLGVLFMFLNAAAVCRIPMTLFEISFLGVRFTAVRYAASLPLLAITAWLFDRHLTRRGYRIAEGVK